MPARPLDAQEREEIRVGLELKQTYIDIAAGLGRHRSTIGAEVKRNGGRRRYCAVGAQRRADKQRARPKTPKLVANSELAAEVTRRLEALDSPKRISVELAATGVSVSAETIYRAVYELDRGLAPGLGQCLHLKRRRRKNRNTKRPNNSALGIICSIHDRPEAALARKEVGHLEGDLIVGANNQSAIITLFDRMTRFLWLTSVAAKTANALDDALIPALLSIPPHILKTLTWDCGAEIAHHPKVALECDVEIYIADPKSPWQRPTNENGNALVRRYVGKGTDLSIYSQQDLNHVATRINTIPRKIFNWQTAQHQYAATVAMTT